MCFNDLCQFCVVCCLRRMTLHSADNRSGRPLIWSVFLYFIHKKFLQYRSLSCNFVCFSVACPCCVLSFLWSLREALLLDLCLFVTHRNFLQYRALSCMFCASVPLSMFCPVLSLEEATALCNSGEDLLLDLCFYVVHRNFLKYRALSCEYLVTVEI